MAGRKTVALTLDNGRKSSRAWIKPLTYYVYLVLLESPKKRRQQHYPICSGTGQMTKVLTTLNHNQMRPRLID